MTPEERLKEEGVFWRKKGEGLPPEYDNRDLLEADTPSGRLNVGRVHGGSISRDT